MNNTTLKLTTAVAIGECPFRISYRNRILVLGSCFSDAVGQYLRDGGFPVLKNPFGTLYNPLSLERALLRLSSGQEYGSRDCVEMGAGANLVCSFEHHSSFAAPTADGFLLNANRSLHEAAAFWKECDTVILTLGTAFVYFHDEVPVGNCLKRPAAEFLRKRIEAGECAEALERMTEGNPDKRFILTVSPIRHLADGAQENSLSKASLLLACDSVCRRHSGRCAYFPAFEIMMDELRDYRFYADDMAHPSRLAASYICSRFRDFAIDGKCLPEMDTRLKEARAAEHKPIITKML